MASCHPRAFMNVLAVTYHDPQMKNWRNIMIERRTPTAPMVVGIISSRRAETRTDSLQDEYETVAVVIADNRRARVYLVAADVSDGSDDEITISGNVKNHVKKGGWSQKRYQRRRDKELKVYAGGIVDALNRRAPCGPGRCRG